MTWKPMRFTVGDEVVDPQRPKWGVRRVIEDRTFGCSPTVGQRLLIKWSDRGLTTVFTALQVLERTGGSTTTTE
jgi:hypothetical protein